MIAFAASKATSLVDAVLFFVYQFAFGIFIGMAVGFIARFIISSISLGVGLYCILVIGLGLVGFAITAYVGGSGFLAIFIIGMCVGNQKTRHVSYILPVSEGFTWLSQITLFLMLGLLVTPHEMIDYWYPGVIIAAVMTVIARPLAVFLCLKPFFRNYNVRDLSFMSWVGLRGSVPIVLAIYPVFEDLDNPQLYFNVAFVVVIVSLLFQGALVVPLSKILSVCAPSVSVPITKSDVGIMLSDDYELLNYKLKEPSFDGATLRTIPFPKGTLVAAIFRDGKMVKCQGDTQVHNGDIISLIGRGADELLLNSLFSHSSIFEILSNVTSVGWVTLLHHFETVTGETPNCSASQIPVFFLVTRTIFIRFKSLAILFNLFNYFANIVKNNVINILHGNNFDYLSN